METTTQILENTQNIVSNLDPTTVGVLNLTVMFVIVILLLVGNIGQAMLFYKSGMYWWQAFIPVYKDYKMIRKTGYPAWILLLYLLAPLYPIVKIFINFSFYKAFTKDNIVMPIIAVIFPPVTLWMGIRDDYKFKTFSYMDLLDD